MGVLTEAVDCGETADEEEDREDEEEVGEAAGEGFQSSEVSWQDNVAYSAYTARRATIRP